MELVRQQNGPSPTAVQQQSLPLMVEFEQSISELRRDVQEVRQNQGAAPAQAFEKALSDLRRDVEQMRQKQSPRSVQEQSLSLMVEFERSISELRRDVQEVTESARACSYY